MADAYSKARPMLSTNGIPGLGLCVLPR